MEQILFYVKGAVAIGLPNLETAYIIANDYSEAEKKFREIFGTTITVDEITRLGIVYN